jgi:hypothetical protein
MPECIMIGVWDPREEISTMRRLFLILFVALTIVGIAQGASKKGGAMPSKQAPAVKKMGAKKKGECPKGGPHVAGKSDKNGRVHCAKCGQIMATKAATGECPKGGAHVAGKVDAKGKLHCARCGQIMASAHPKKK